MLTHQQGIYYSARHPSLFTAVKAPIYKSVALSIVVTVLFFAILYLPQVAFLAFTSGPFAFITAIPVVFGEAAVTSHVLSNALWLSDAHDKLFDAVRPFKFTYIALLQSEFFVHPQVLASHPSSAPLIDRAKTLTKTSLGRSSKIGKLLLKPVSRFSPAELVRYLISLPLSIVPGLGTAFFLVYNVMYRCSS